MNWQVCAVTDLCNGMYGGRLVQRQVYAVAGFCSGNLCSDNLRLWQFALRYYVLPGLYSMNLIYLSI